MYSILGIRILLICFCLFRPISLRSQLEVTVFTDLGANNSSQGLFLNSSTIGQYQFGRNLVQSGLRINLKSNTKNTLQGFRILASRDVVNKRKPLQIQGFLLQTTSSDLLRQTNWGGILQLKRKYYDLAIGTNFRTYAFRNEAIHTYDIESNATKQSEPWNLMYLLTIYLKQNKASWNMGLSVANFDYFLINQETNPQFHLNGLCRLNTQISLMAQLWYEASGLLNRYTNFFGLFSRTGIIWNIK